MGHVTSKGSLVDLLLLRYELGIESFGVVHQERLVAAVFNNYSLLEHEDSVGLFDRGESVGNGDCRDRAHFLF